MDDLNKNDNQTAPSSEDATAQTPQAQPSEDSLKKITELEERLTAMEENWKRALADYKNFEKRMVEEKEQILNFAALEIIANILPVLDNLEMMDAHMNDMGLKLTIKDFKQILGNLGVKEIDALGKNFDSNSMDAVETVEGEKNKVVEVLTKGFLLKDKLIRPAKVKVGKGS